LLLLLVVGYVVDVSCVVDNTAVAIVTVVSVGGVCCVYVSYGCVGVAGVVVCVVGGFAVVGVVYGVVVYVGGCIFVVTGGDGVVVVGV